MDPFSLIVGIAGLAGLAATTITSAKSYMFSVKHKANSIAMLVTELEALQANLASLDAFLHRVSVKDLTFQPTSVLRSYTTACTTSLKALSEKLNHADERKMSRFIWPLSEKEHQKSMEDLQNFSRWIQFALSIDGCSLLLRTSDDVQKVLEGQLEILKMLQSLEDTSSQLSEAVKNQTLKLQDQSSARMRERVVSWISDFDYGQKHFSVRQPRVEGTGSWLWEQSDFVDWRDGTASSNVLWCHGIQGSGKSVLTSMVIDKLRASNIGAPVAFFYFDYQDEVQQTPTAVLSSILKQLLITQTDLPKSIFKAYEERHHSGTIFSLEQLEYLLHDVLKSLHQAYIIIDALDECDKSRNRKPLLLLFQRLQKISNISLFVTSRQNFQDIIDVFSRYPQITITAHNFDLERYMRQEMENYGIEETVDDSFVNGIIGAIITKAQGMFLPAILHCRMVLQEPTAGAMEDALKSLPTSLDSAFAKTFTRIERLPESRKRLGISILMWISHAKSALRVSELSDALSVKQGQTRMNPKYRPSHGIMLECCQGLVSVDLKTDRIYLAHYSIQEYLVKHSDSLFTSVEKNLGMTCLTYLRFEDFTDGPVLHSAAVQDRITSYPLLPYAAKFWGVHLRNLLSDKATKNFTVAFLQCQNAIACGNQAYQYENGYTKRYWNAEECLSYTALHICSYFGLDDILLDLLEQGKLSVNTATKMGTTPIIKAASKGYVSTVRLLLDRGADPYLENWYGNALHCAAEAGKSETIRELVSYGMSPNSCERYFRSPLRCTIDNDSASAFETLIALGADINATDVRRNESVSILHLIAAHNCFNIMDLVLKHRWVDLECKSKKGGTALRWAAKRGNLLMLRKLTEAGAYIEAKGAHER